MLSPNNTTVETGPTIGERAAAIAKGMDEGQSKQIDDRGYGDYTGTQSGESKRDGNRLKKTDCTIYVLDTLKATFKAAGLSADWDKVFKDAVKNSGGAFKGTELMKSLQSILGWVGVFWAPDTKSGDGEHDYSAAMAKKGKGYYGISVDADKTVTDYAPSKASRKKTDKLEQLKRVNFGVLCARGGSHMAMIIKGNVYEVHWSYTADSHDLIEFTPLQDWGWGSGAIVMPPDEVANWNGTGQ